MDPVDLKGNPVFIADKVYEYPVPGHGRIFIVREGGCSFYTDIGNLEVTGADRTLSILALKKELERRLEELRGAPA